MSWLDIELPPQTKTNQIVSCIFSDPADYGTWFEEKMTGEVPTLKGLNLFSNVERSVNNAM